MSQPIACSDYPSEYFNDYESEVKLENDTENIREMVLEQLSKDLDELKCPVCDTLMRPEYENNGYDAPDPTHYEITGFKCPMCFNTKVRGFDYK